MKKTTAAIFVLAAILLGGFIRSMAQTMPVTLIAAPAGSTLTNCGTPTVPSVCVVATGVYIWQNATQGWFLAAASVPATGIQSITVCNAAGASCGTASTGPAVTLNIPKTVIVTAPVITSNVTATAPTATLQ
jgi:hypothetical protein